MITDKIQEEALKKTKESVSLCSYQIQATLEFLFT